jgi:hypothetical protein
MIELNDLSDDFKSAAWKFLMLMPTVASVPRTSKELCELMAHCHSELQIWYLLQVALTRPIDDVEPLVFRLLSSRIITKFAYFKALSLVKDHMNFPGITEAEALCGFFWRRLPMRTQ